jgi:hypothetical protein
MIFNVFCTKEIHVNYQVNSAYIYESKAQKFKNKNEAEYISILYTSLYQKAIDPMELFQAQSVLYSIGDQNVAKEMLLSGYFNNPKIIIPSNAEMRKDISIFIDETYKRFYLRYPSEAEKAYFTNYIKNNPEVTVELIYTAFSTSDEYSFY